MKILKRFFLLSMTLIVMTACSHAHPCFQKGKIPSSTATISIASLTIDIPNGFVESQVVSHDNIRRQFNSENMILTIETGADLPSYYTLRQKLIKFHNFSEKEIIVDGVVAHNYSLSFYHDLPSPESFEIESIKLASGLFIPGTSTRPPTHLTIEVQREDMLEGASEIFCSVKFKN